MGLEYSVDHMTDGSFELSLFDDEENALILLKTFATYPSEEDVLATIWMYKRLKGEVTP